MAPRGCWLFPLCLQGGHLCVQPVPCTCPWCRGDARDPDSDSRGVWRSLAGTRACSPSRAARVLLCTPHQFCWGLEIPKLVPAPSPLGFVWVSVCVYFTVPFPPFHFALVSFLPAYPPYSFVFSVLLVSTLQPSICSPPSHPQSPPPASSNCNAPAPGVVLPPLAQASTVSSAPAVPEPAAAQSPFLAQCRAREPTQFLHRHSASDLPAAPGSSPPPCPNGRTVMPGIRRTSLSPPPPHPPPFPSHQLLRGSSLSCSPQSPSPSVTNAPSLPRGDVLQPRGPTMLPVIPVPPDRVKAPTDKAGWETSANAPLNGHPEEQIALGPPGAQVKSVDGSFFPHLGSVPCSPLPTIASPPSSSGQAPSPSSHLPSCPAQQWCQPMSHCLPLPPPHAAVSEVALPRRTPPYMTSSAIAHLSKYWFWMSCDLCKASAVTCSKSPDQ